MDADLRSNDDGILEEALIQPHLDAALQGTDLADFEDEIDLHLWYGGD